MPSRTMLFTESASGSEPAAVLCAPRPRRVQVHPCSAADLILGPPPFLLNNKSSSSREEGGKGKPAAAEEEEDDGGCWAVLGGSPPARADNPLVHDPHFLLNQRQPPPVLELGFSDDHHRSRTSYVVHRPTYTNTSSSSSFAPSSFAPAVRIQGFDVAAACRSSHSNGGGGGRVLSARA